MPFRIKDIVMRRILILAWLLTAPLCSAQILIPPCPKAVSYMLLAGQLPRPLTSALTPDEDTKFQQVYTAALHSDLAMDAEGDNLNVQFDKYRNALADAMAKAEPQIQPAMVMAAKDPVNISDAQRQEVLEAQAAVMKADPKWQSQWDDLSQKMIAHEKKVEATMLKIDPSIAPILAKFLPGDPGPGTSATKDNFNPGSMNDPVH